MAFAFMRISTKIQMQVIWYHISWDMQNGWQDLSGIGLPDTTGWYQTACHNFWCCQADWHSFQHCYTAGQSLEVSGSLTKVSRSPLLWYQAALHHHKSVRQLDLIPMRQVFTEQSGHANCLAPFEGLQAVTVVGSLPSWCQAACHQYQSVWDC